MHTPSILVATIAVLSTIASAEVERPKFYYPKQIRRQVSTNANATTSASEDDKQDPFTSSFSSSSTKRDLGDILDPPTTPTDTSDETIVTIIVTNTNIVGPEPTDVDSSDASVGSTGGMPPVVVLPTTTDASVNTGKTVAPSATGSGIKSRPDGVRPSTSDKLTSTDTRDVTTGDITSAGGTSAPAASSTGDPGIPIIGPIVSKVSSILDPHSEPSDTSDIPTSTDPATTLSPGTTHSPTSSNLLDTIIGGLTGILPTGTGGLSGPPTGTPPVTTDTSVPTSTTDSTGLGQILTSLLDPSGSHLLPTTILTSDPFVSPTHSGVVTTPTIPPTGTPINSTDIVQPTSPVTTPTDITSIPTGTSSVTLPSGSVTPGNSTTPIDTATTLPTSIPGLNGTESTSLPSGTAPTTAAPTVSPTNGTGIAPTTAPSGTSVTATPTITNGPTQTGPPSVILPTATDSGTSMWLPPNIIIASSPTLSLGQVPTSGPTGLPSGVPKIIMAPNVTDVTPEGMALVQLGFKYPLNYAFVASNSITAAQIFQFLPEGLIFGLKLDEGQVQMQSLQPLNTQRQKGYVTTLALTYIPQHLLSTLTLGLQTPVSPLYNNPDSSVNQLMNYIDNTIPLQPGSNLPLGDATGTGAVSQPTGAKSGNNGIFDTTAQNTSPKVKSTTAGIVVGCAGAAAAYGAAMFFIARRYKRKKSSHRRSSSIMSNSEMRQSGSPALMGGTNAIMAGGRTTPGTNIDRNSRGSGRSAGNSARTQQISAPMMAENSLGWN